MKQGYGGSAENKNAEIITLTITKADKAEKIWSSGRFDGENFLKKRHFEKVSSEGRVLETYSGKSIVVTQATPVQMVYSMKQQRVTTTFYVQRYDLSGFAKDSTLQKLMNSGTV